VHSSDGDNPAPHRRPDGSFRNPWPDSEPRGWLDVLRWSIQRRRQKLAPTPARGSFPVATPAISHPRADETSFAATWIGHSIPIGAYDPRWFMHVVHVDPDEAVQIYKDLIAAHDDVAPPLMLAIHWGTFRLTDEPMEEPPRRAHSLWRKSGLDEERLWIARFGETRIFASKQ
jgi:hypothetical protein